MSATENSESLVLELFQDPKAGTREEYEYLAVDLIDPDPAQPRTDVDKSLDEDPAFVESIRVQGVLEPIEVGRNGDRFTLVFGERRLRGSIRVKRATIPAIIRKPGDVQDELRRLLRQAAENLHKELTPIDEARFYKRLFALLPPKDKSVGKLAKIVGRPKSTVSDRLALADAPEPLQRFFLSGECGEAAAPIFKKYTDVPLTILEQSAPLIANSWQFEQARRERKPVPLEGVKAVLNRIICQHLMAEVPEEIALEYQGPTFTLGGTVYATDTQLLQKVALEHHRRVEAENAKSTSGRTSSSPRRSDPHEAKRRREGQLRRLQFVAVAEKLPTKIEGGWVDFLVEGISREVHQDTHRVLVSQLGLLKRKGEQNSDVIKRHAKSLDEAGLTKLALQLLIVPDVAMTYGGQERLRRAAQLTKVDLKKVKLPEPAKKSTKAAKGAAKRTAKRRPLSMFMKPMRPDAALAAVVGEKPLPRTEITKKLWQYIKRHGLQDKRERRMINADDKLRVVFNGRKRVSMFEMTKLLDKHYKLATA